jgi:3-methyladenine DNA glycosylase/8-oxoguanine DNA glycosylase
MTISHLLEDFSASVASEGPVRPMSEEALEDHRLTAFEQGYTAGWDDAILAQTEDQTRVMGALARSLESCSFTYHEAMGQMTKSVRPVFQGLVDAVLPEMMAAAFGQHIVENLCELARDRAAQPAYLVVPPGKAEALKPVIAQGFPMPVEILEDAEMAPDRAGLRVGEAELELDLTQMLGSIRTAVNAFIYQTEKDSHYG